MAFAGHPMTAPRTILCALVLPGMLLGLASPLGGASHGGSGCTSTVYPIIVAIGPVSVYRFIVHERCDYNSDGQADYDEFSEIGTGRVGAEHARTISTTPYPPYWSRWTDVGVFATTTSGNTFTGAEVLCEDRNVDDTCDFTYVSVLSQGPAGTNSVFLQLSHWSSNWACATLGGTSRCVGPVDGPLLSLP